MFPRLFTLHDIFHFLFPLETDTSASRFYSMASGNTLTNQAYQSGVLSPRPDVQNLLCVLFPLLHAHKFTCVCLSLVWLNTHAVSHFPRSHHCPGTLKESWHTAGKGRYSNGGIHRSIQGSIHAGIASQTAQEKASWQSPQNSGLCSWVLSPGCFKSLPLCPEITTSLPCSYAPRASILSGARSRWVPWESSQLPADAGDGESLCQPWSAMSAGREDVSTGTPFSLQWSWSDQKIRCMVMKQGTPARVS